MKAQTPAKFSDCIRAAYELRALIGNRKWGAAYRCAETLEGNLQQLGPVGVPVHNSSNPRELVDALIAQGECGSIFGMTLSMRQLLPLLDRITGDIDEAKRETVAESGGK
jgi:hypothetical protein